TALGIGERVGNAALDQILLNLKLLGELPDHDLTKLVEWCLVASRATHVPIHPQYPLAGTDAFRTATGVHAAAIIKARTKGDEWLADRVYSGVPASMVGRHQVIEVGPMSGLSNVQCWLEDRGLEARPELVDAIFRKAKESDHVLEDVEILEIVQRLAPSHEPASASRR
ncbi:MAG TPA: 2-isopropylmalate synthase, partial [Thermoanaerobaculia bacterium]